MFGVIHFIKGESCAPDSASSSPASLRFLSAITSWLDTSPTLTDTIKRTNCARVNEQVPYLPTLWSALRLSPINPCSTKRSVAFSCLTQRRICPRLMGITRCPKRPLVSRIRSPTSGFRSPTCLDVSRQLWILLSHLSQEEESQLLQEQQLGAQWRSSSSVVRYGSGSV